MTEQTPKGKFPPAMLDMGMPQEMSPFEQITSTKDETPMVEVTRQEPWETSDALEASEIRQDEI